MSTDLAPQQPKQPPVPVLAGEHGLQFGSLEEMFRFAQYVVRAGLGGREATPEEVLVRVQVGMELGFSPMRALNAVHTVEGRPTLDYKAVLAKIREVGICDYGPHVGNAGEGDALVGFIEFKRRDMADRVRVEFSVAQAKAAKLWGKTTRTGSPTPWVLYPEDMLIARAVGRANNRYFSDVTMGLRVAEEARDVAAQHGDEKPPRDVTPPKTRDPLLDIDDPNVQTIEDHRREELRSDMQKDKMDAAPADLDATLAAADQPDDVDAALDAAAAKLGLGKA